jgi:hypothetical protein
MSRLRFAAGLALAVAAALSLAGPVAAGEPVPFKGSLEGDVTRGIPLFPHVGVVVEGMGKATQLGAFTFDFSHTVHIPTRTGKGTYHIVAANGDKLIATADGVADDSEMPGVLYIVEKLTIDPTASTGRFAGATGAFTIERWYDMATGETIGFFEGTISSPGQ